MKRLLSVLIFIFLIMNISASCNETQIDINSASMEELDNLTGIGPVYASRIIEGRQFGSVDDLVDVEGIGEKTLEKIKEQGLACVDGEIQNYEENDLEEETEDNFIGKEAENNSIKEETKVEDVEETESLIYENFSQGTSKEAELTPIILNSKSIKSEEDNENLRKNLALGGIVTFCVMFGALFLLKTRKRKNEFR